MMEWASGQKPSSGADSLSRYMTFAVMYEHYKKQGLRGKALAEKAAEATEQTMVMYNMPYKSPLLQNTGMFGQAISPLLTFATAQQGLLVADAKLALKTGNVAPLLVTSLTAALMGGAIGLPLIAEWTLLNELLGLGLPDIREVLLEMDKNKEDVLGIPAETVLLGGPTASVNSLAKTMGMEEGWDIGSGLRWNQIISKQITGDGSMWDALPAVSYTIKVSQAMATLIKKDMGEHVTDAEYRKSAHTLSILVGTKFATDMVTGYTNRTMNAQGAASRASKATTDADRISSLIGAQSVSSRKENIRNERLMKLKKDAKTEVQKMVPNLTEELMRGDTGMATDSIGRIITADPTTNIPGSIEKDVRARVIDQATKDLMHKNPNVIQKRIELGQ